MTSFHPSGRLVETDDTASDVGTETASIHVLSIGVFSVALPLRMQLYFWLANLRSPGLLAQLLTHLASFGSFYVR